MPEILRKIWHSLIDKLSAILRFVYFSFIPRNRSKRYWLVGLVVVCVLALVIPFVVSTYALAAPGDGPDLDLGDTSEAAEVSDAAAEAKNAEAAKIAEEKNAAKQAGSSSSSSSSPAATSSTTGGLGDKLMMFLNNILFAICQVLGWVALKIFALIVLISSNLESWGFKIRQVSMEDPSWLSSARMLNVFPVPTSPVSSIKPFRSWTPYFSVSKTP